MIWEFVAALCAGLGAAGMAMGARWLSANKLPRWIVPAFAGAAMISFQIYTEYTWFSHQKSLLPDNVEVVKAIEEKSFWRPWTLLRPQVIRFAAIQVGPASVNAVNPQLVLANVYFFERRKPAKHLPQVFHCSRNARAHLSDQLTIPMPGESLNGQWLSVPQNDPLLSSVCSAAGFR